MAGRRLRGARSVAGTVHSAHRSGDPATGGSGLGETVAANGWLLVPIAVERASYGPVIFLAGVAGSFALAFLLVRKFYHGRLRRCAALGLRLSLADAAHAGHRRGVRPADPADIRTVLPHGPAVADAVRRAPRYRVTIGDHFWYWLYLPDRRCVERIAKLIGLLQQGRISVYLLYSFLTLIAVLVWVKR